MPPAPQLFLGPVFPLFLMLLLLLLIVMTTTAIDRVIEIFSHYVALVKTVDAIAKLTTFPNGAADNRNNGNN